MEVAGAQQDRRITDETKGWLYCAQWITNTVGEDQTKDRKMR